MNGYPVEREVSAQSEAANRIPAKYQLVNGSAASQKPGTVYSGDINIVDGSLDVKLAGDEEFKGQARPVDPAAEGQAPKTSGAPELGKDWDLIYGADYYEKQVKGNPQTVRALMVSNSGTTLVTEIVHEASNSYTGVARDGRGNLYKVSFGD